MSAVGVTATRCWLTEYQLKQAEQELGSLRQCGFDTLRHGDCICGDEQLADIGRQLGFRIIAHPPVSDHLRAYYESDIVLPPQDYHLRNRAIVDNSAYLIGCPKEWPEVLRSGTWATIRYARRKGIRLAVIPPNPVGAP